MKISGTNLGELNEYWFASGSGKQKKKWFHLPHLLSHESFVSVKENTNRKRKKEERKKEKNTDRTQTKLNAPHVMYNVKILPQ